MGLVISVVIPAYNEAAYLPQTLGCLMRSVEHEGGNRDLGWVEVIVADSVSTDRTSEVAGALGARVVSVPKHNISRVRNVGAAAARGELLVFLDADTLVPEEFLGRILKEMEPANCLGGAWDTDYRPARCSVRVYLRLWRWLGLWLGMAQGAAQFCRRDAFVAVGRFEESLFMGEDVDFFWRLRKLAKSKGQYVQIVRDLQVVPSCRRFDQWPLWRILIKTNPFYIFVFKRMKFAWQGWYHDVPR